MKTGKIFSLLIIALGIFGLYLLKDCSAVIRLFAASLGMIGVIKIAALIWQRSEGMKFQSSLGLFLYLGLWPGVSVKGFTERRDIVATTGANFFEAWLMFLMGLGLLVGVSIVARGESTILNYFGLFSILLIVHLGFIEVLADSIRLLGFAPQSLFDRPYLATSLRDFWSVRWNLAFVDMNKIFIMRPLRNKVPLTVLTFSIFAVSGILHELGVSYADGVSWGTPFFYFVIQSIGIEIEKRRKLPRVLVWMCLILPIPLLFPPAFTNLFLGSLSRSIADFVFSLEMTEILKYGLVLGSLAHVLVLCASIQVPGKLGWIEEFKKLNSLNRKVFWTYGGYIFSIIIFMSLVSFLLSRQGIDSWSLSSLLWILFIALFWWARVLTDFFYMSHEDWPQGPLFTIGHVCLTTLFISMAVLYTTLAIIAYGAIK
jgi:hypothetical protein